MQKIDNIIIHKVGNKLNEEQVIFSEDQIEFSSEKEIILQNYFLNSIKPEEYYKFQHESDMSLNEIYVYASRIFLDKTNFIEDSKYIAKHLYKYSEHPKIKSGDLYVVYFVDFLINDEKVDAIGIFKSENKDTFIKVKKDINQFELLIDTGANASKLDKGCIIYNLEKESGYLVSIIDNTSKSGIEARYWKDDFLYVKHRKDNYFHTQNTLSLCKNFVTQALPQSISKADQVDILNKSVKYFKENESFDMAAFSKEVITNPDLIEIFNRYKSEFELARELAILENFEISESAVKKQARSIKSVIKLDKNFHIYVHGSRELIQQGMDEDGRKYYKIYFEEEN